MPDRPAEFPTHQQALPLGLRLGEFELRRQLGEGGFSIVYLAWDQSLQRSVALKEYMPTSLAARVAGGTVQPRSESTRETFEMGLRSFINEARALAQFDHPALVKVHRFWEAHGTAYMVMPFYEGQTLKQTRRAMPRAPDEAWLLGLLDPLTEALAVIHAANWYHRDIAPDNVILLAASGRPLLLDFGAARRVIGESTQALTAILKPGYAPVEQYADLPGLKQGAWTDLYALAATVYWLITGNTPPPAVGRMLQDTYVPLVVAAAGRYSEAFLQAIDAALAVLPEQRTRSIDEFRRQIGLGPPDIAPAVVPGTAPPSRLAEPSSETTLLLPTRPAVAADASAPTLTRAPTPTPQPASASALPPASAGRPRLLAAGASALLLAALGIGVWRWTSAPVASPAAAGASPAASSVRAAPLHEPSASVAAPVAALPTPAAPAPSPTPSRIDKPAPPAAREPAVAAAGAQRERECAALLQRLSLGEDSREVSERLAALRCR